MDESIDGLLDALSESGIVAEDEGSLLDDFGHLDESTSHHSTLLADVSPSSQTFATQSIDAVVAKAGPPPLPPLPFRFHGEAANHHLVDVDYCRIQVECLTLSDETAATKSISDEALISSQCHSLLKPFGADALLCLRYELPPLTSNPEIAAGGADAIVDNDRRRVMVTISDVLNLYPLLPSSAAPAHGRTDVNRRRIKNKSNRLTPSAASNIRQERDRGVGIGVGSGCGGGEGAIQLKHSNLLAIAFVSDKDIASWGSSITIDLVCTTKSASNKGGGVGDESSDTDPVRLASGRFPLEDVLSSRSFDVRLQLDLMAEGASSLSAPRAVGSLVVRVTLIGGNSCEEEEDRFVSKPTHTKLPIVESPQKADRVTSPGNTACEVPEKKNDHFAGDQSMPTDHSQLQNFSTQPQHFLHLPPAPIPAPTGTPDHRRLEYRPTLHPSDTRVALERQICQNDAANRIQACIRGHLFRRGRQRREEEEGGCIDEVEVGDSPPPPPPPPTPPTAPLVVRHQQHFGDLPGQGDTPSVDAPLPDPCRSCNLSSLGDCSPPTSQAEVIISRSDTPPAEGQMRFGIRLGSCKGLAEVVSTCQEPGPCLFESDAMVVVSYAIFNGIDGLEATFYSKALPLHRSTSSFDFDSEQMIAISLRDERTIQYLKNKALEMKLWLLPASHSSKLPSAVSSGSFTKKTSHGNLLATTNLSLAPLFDCPGVSGCRQTSLWRPQGWLDEECIGSIEVAMYFEGAAVDQLQPYSPEDMFSVSGAISKSSAAETPMEGNNGSTRGDDLPSFSSSVSSSPPGDSSAKERKQRDDRSGATSSGTSISSSRSNSVTSSDGLASIGSGSSSSNSCSGGSSCSSSTEKEFPAGNVQSLSGVMESLESVKKSLSHHFDGESGIAKADVSEDNNDEDMVDISQSYQKEYANEALTAAAKSNKLPGATSSGEEDDSPTATSTSFVDVGTSPIDLGADSAPACKQAVLEVDVTLAFASEEAASQTDRSATDDAPCRSMAERFHKATNTIPVHSPSSSSTGSSDGDLNCSQVSTHAWTCSTASTNPQIHSTFQRRRRLFSSTVSAHPNAADSTSAGSSPTATSRGLTRARIPLHYGRSRFKELPASATAAAASLSSTDRISNIMRPRPCPSGFLLGRSLHQRIGGDSGNSSSSSGSCSSSSDGEEEESI